LSLLFELERRSLKTLIRTFFVLVRAVYKRWQLLYFSQYARHLVPAVGVLFETVHVDGLSCAPMGLTQNMRPLIGWPQIFWGQSATLLSKEDCNDGFAALRTQRAELTLFLVKVPS
jgi:hypothetical protein